MILVGQKVQIEIDKFNLQQGEDYSTYIDLSEMFIAYHPRYGTYNYSSLQHEANTLIKPGTIINWL